LRNRYGHKLPVMSLDISSDSKMIITGSADKNIKIWGLDFGDCHKSIFAHNDSIMTLGFVPGTHYFFSAGKDKMIKYWDGDKFEQILSIPGHHGEVCTPPPAPSSLHLRLPAIRRTPREISFRHARQVAVQGRSTVFSPLQSDICLQHIPVETTKLKIKPRALQALLPGFATKATRERC
jgi:hypothetical protein